MSLKLVNEGHLCCIVKCSVVIAVLLACCLIVGAMMLAKEVVDDGIEGEQNLLDISDSSIPYMLLIN